MLVDGCSRKQLMHSALPVTTLTGAQGGAAVGDVHGSHWIHVPNAVRYPWKI